MPCTPISADWTTSLAHLLYTSSCEHPSSSTSSKVKPHWSLLRRLFLALPASRTAAAPLLPVGADQGCRCTTHRSRTFNGVVASLLIGRIRQQTFIFPSCSLTFIDKMYKRPVRGQPNPKISGSDHPIFDLRKPMRRNQMWRNLKRFFSAIGFRRILIFASIE